MAQRTEKVAESVARQILQDIRRNRLGPGSMLPPESTMVERFGVGRGSLREALRILEVNGLVTLKPGPRGGPVVAPHAPGNFGQMIPCTSSRLAPPIASYWKRDWSTKSCWPARRPSSQGKRPADSSVSRWHRARTGPTSSGTCRRPADSIAPSARHQATRFSLSPLTPSTPSGPSA